MTDKRAMNRPVALIPFALLAALVAAGALWRLGDLRAHDRVESVPTGEIVTLGGPFSLTDQNGIARTEKDYRGKYTLVFFGYTYCPDVCPTELQSISLALDKLGAVADAVQPLFVTVDPERDTPARLAEFVSSFHPKLVGLTGPLADIRKTAIAYRVFFAKHQVPATNYPVDHTGFIYVVGKDGRFLGYLPPGASPDDIADAIRSLLGPE